MVLLQNLNSKKEEEKCLRPEKKFWADNCLLWLRLLLHEKAFTIVPREEIGEHRDHEMIFLMKIPQTDYGLNFNWVSVVPKGFDFESLLWDASRVILMHNMFDNHTQKYFKQLHDLSN